LTWTHSIETCIDYIKLLKLKHKLVIHGYVGLMITYADLINYVSAIDKSSLEEKLNNLFKFDQ